MSSAQKRQFRPGQPPGEGHALAKLTDQKVRGIHARVLAGESCAKVARDLGIHVRTVEDICHGRSWKHLGLPPIPPRRGAKKPGSKLTEQDVPVIYRRLQDGDSISQVARDYDVNRTVIADIWYGRKWKHVPRTSPRTKVWE